MPLTGLRGCDAPPGGSAPVIAPIVTALVPTVPDQAAARAAGSPDNGVASITLFDARCPTADAAGAWIVSTPSSAVIPAKEGSLHPDAGVGKISRASG